MAVKGLDKGQRAALVISECQNGITNLAYAPSTLADQVAERGIMGKIGELAAAFRARDLPVIHAHVTMRAGGKGWQVNCLLAHRIAKEGKLVTGTPFAASHYDLPLAAGDTLSERHHGMSPFTNTGLDAVLRSYGIETVVLVGVSTNVALPSATAEAVGLGYHVVIAEDCTAGGTAETHQMQVTMHLPLIATLASGADVAAALTCGP